jgi:hypothetical protein
MTAACTAKAVSNTAKGSGNTRKLFDSRGGDNHIASTTAEASPIDTPSAINAARVSAAAAVVIAIMTSEISEYANRPRPIRKRRSTDSGASPDALVAAM